MYSDTAGEHDGLLEEPLLERVALPRAQRASGKPRRKRPPVGLGSKSSDAANNENDFGESSDGEHLGFEQLDQAQVVGTEMPVLPPILTSLSAPLISTSVPDVPLDAPETGDTRRLQLLAASEAPRRPNPWEHSNKKTFKPIITIGKQSGSALAAVKKRQLFSLPFAQQRRLPAQAPEPRVTASPPLFATEGIVSFRCGTLCVGAALDVREVFTHYSRKGLQCTAYKDGLNVVVLVQHPTDDLKGDAHAFYFMYGSIVLWNFSAASEDRLVQETRSLFARESYAEPEMDDFAYTYLDTEGAKPHIHKDVIHLSTNDIMEKLAVSFGLGQSAKLSVFERTAESTIADTRHIPEQLAATGRITLSRNEISMRVGQLFVDRSQVNLHSDMLDTPAFFWEEAEWEPLYQRTAKYMEIEKRVSVLNHRLDIIADLFDMLASEMHQKHASNLEIIVIVLIVIEVLFQVLGLVQQHFSGEPLA